ncbi:MAG: DUF2335 domain-containing protein [Synechococcaceae cyanobacterium]
MAAESDNPMSEPSSSEGDESSEGLSAELSVDQDADTKVLKDDNQGPLAVEASYSFMGPIPPPGILAGYNNVIPNGADRVIKMAEQEQAHRHNIETTIVGKESFEKRVGLVFAFILALSVLGVSSYLLIFTEKSGYGLTVFIIELGGLVWAFLGAKEKRQRDISEEESAE